MTESFAAPAPDPLGMPEESGLPAASSRPELSDAEAMENAEIFMDVRETGQSLALAWWVEGSLKNSDEYNYDPGDKRKLVRAWSKIIGKYRITVSPWIEVVMVEATTTGPLVAAAYKAHQYRLESERKDVLLRAQAAKIAEMERSQGHPVADPGVRADTKTQWQVDDNGFFTYTVGNSYIKTADRNEKPELTADNYAKLVRHNGKEKIDRIFKI